ncbi:hypothetical protein D3C85_1461330 [compost metagenome]
MSAGRQAAQQRLKELAQLLELVDIVQFTGIEHHRLELGPEPGHPLVGLKFRAGKAV